MGLSLVVGMLADLIENDPEGAEWIREGFEAVNRFLASQSLPPHQEPESCKVWSCQMYGYSGLHYLRRIAAHLALEGVLPPPGNVDAAKDAILQRYYENFDASPAQAQSGRGSFLHLVIHSDAEGYYLPQDFPKVLFPGPEFEIPGGMIGSSYRLLEECERLAAALQLPLGLDPENEMVWEAADSQGTGEQLWQRYGVESFTCLRLYTAAKQSIETGAAVVFT